MYKKHLLEALTSKNGRRGICAERLQFTVSEETFEILTAYLDKLDIKISPFIRELVLKELSKEGLVHG